MNQPPTHSPWGAIQHSVRLADGIWSVTTSNHGGLWLSPERIEQLNQWILIAPGTGQLQEYVTFVHDPQWWEEDCDWCTPIVAFADEIGDPKLTEIANVTLRSLANGFGGKYLVSFVKMNERNQNIPIPKVTDRCLCGGDADYHEGRLGYEAVICIECGEHWHDSCGDDHEEHVRRYLAGQRNGVNHELV